MFLSLCEYTDIGADEDGRCFRSESLQRRRRDHQTGQRVIRQVSVFTPEWKWKRFNRKCVFLPQGDAADCFYIVESGVVKIMIKRKVNCNTWTSERTHYLTPSHSSPGIVPRAKGRPSCVIPSLSSLAISFYLKCYFFVGGEKTLKCATPEGSAGPGSGTCAVVDSVKCKTDFGT